MKKTEFEQYVENSVQQDRGKINQANFDILRAVSKADSKKIQRFGAALSSKQLVNELVSFFGFEKIGIPVECAQLDEQLQYVADKIGVLRRKIVLRGSWYSETTAPLLCQYNGAQIMLIPSGNGYTFTVPTTGKPQALTEEIAKEISPDAYCFYRPFQKDKMGFLDLCKFIAHCVTLTEVTQILVVSAVVLLINMMLPYLNKVLFDVVVPSGTTDDIWTIAGLMLGAAVAVCSFNLLKTLHFKMLGNQVRVYLQGALWARIIHLPTTFFKQYSSSEVYMRADSLVEIGDILSGQAVNMLITSALSFVYLYQISLFSAALLAPTILVSLALILFSVIISVLSVRHQKKQIEWNTKLSGFVYEVFAGISKIKTAAAQARVFSKWAEKYSRLTNVTYSPNALITMSNAIYTVLALGGTILIYFTVAQNQVAPADFIGFSVAFSAFTVILLQLQGIVVQIANVQSFFELAKPILQTAPENNGHLPRVTSLKGNIDIANVNFAYSPDAPPVLENINVSIRAGEYVAIVGTSGSGKSTLLRILLGFETPLSGTVYYDDKDIKGVDIASIRKNIGVVMQNGTLFADDIYANIAICNPSLTVEEAFEVAKAAGLEDDINNMPMGMHTIIGEDGGGISGGQKQRIMIARAFASRPSILMFDEATSALDNLTQRKIITSLEEFDATKIVIAHRLSTVRHCDKIIVLHEGRVTETGSYDALMEQKGLFYSMAQRQLV